MKIRKPSLKKGLKKLFTLRPWQLIVLFLLILGCVTFYFLILKDLPSPTALNSATIPQSTQIFDRNGKLLYTVYAEKNQTFLPLSQIPKHMQQATIAIEDKDFYKHGAIDIRGIARAAYSTIVHKQLQGGSTLTQQLVKTSLLTLDRTITRKVKEIVLAFATELIYPKDKILEMYLNQVPYGGTSSGVEAASQAYFNKHAKKLTLPEAALLAALPEAPSTFSPNGAHPELAKARQKQVLINMEEQGYITKKQRDEAIAAPLNIQPVSNNIKAPHFVLYVKELLEKKYGERVVAEGGLKVKTSLDLDIQNFAQDAVATEVAELKNLRVGNGAAVITNPGTGEILAMVGSKDYFDTEGDGNVNITTASRQPGSSIKPINYALGLIKGYTAATPFVDKQICFPSGSGAPYCPVNYDGKFHGVILMREALGNSINIPAVKMLKLNGVTDMLATASAMGIKSLSVNDASHYGLSLTLGGGEVTMLEMATAYGVFANQGYRIDLHPILKVTDSKGKVLEEYTPPPSPIFGKKVLSSAVAYITSQMLLDNNARTLAFGPSSSLKVGNKPVSVKTGTTNDYRDNWTIGYTPSALVAVWVGNNDNTPMGGLVSGITGAAPIWNTLMSHILKDKTPEWPQKPDGVIAKVVCSTSGLLAPPEGTPDRCPTRLEYFVRGTEPTKMDSGKQKVFVDKGTQDLATPGQTDNVEEKDHVVVTDPTGDRYCVTCPHPEPEKK